MSRRLNREITKLEREEEAVEGDEKITVVRPYDHHIIFKNSKLQVHFVMPADYPSVGPNVFEIKTIPNDEILEKSFKSLLSNEKISIRAIIAPSLGTWSPACSLKQIFNEIDTRVTEFEPIITTDDDEGEIDLSRLEIDCELDFYVSLACNFKFEFGGVTNKLPKYMIDDIDKSNINILLFDIAFETSFILRSPEQNTNFFILKYTILVVYPIIDSCSKKTIKAIDYWDCATEDPINYEDDSDITKNEDLPECYSCVIENAFYHFLRDTIIETISNYKNVYIDNYYFTYNTTNKYITNKHFINFCYINKILIDLYTEYDDDRLKLIHIIYNSNEFSDTSDLIPFLTNKCTIRNYK